MAARLVLVLASIALASQAVGAAPFKPPTRLFADDQPIRIALRGPIQAVARMPLYSRAGRPAVLTVVSPTAETHAILLSPRGLTRRMRETCVFPPLRIEFTARPSPASLFERQHRLKLTTHCRTAPGYQGHILLEYAAYRLFNLVTPASLRVRLAAVDYAGEDGRPIISRLGFFAEDMGDAARRNGLVEVRTTARVEPAQLDADASARAGLFEYLIGNLDWSMRAGPAGDTCCHNFKLMAAAANARSGIVPVPYDFDYSGLVNAPYALPPEGIPVGSVRERRYRGYCMHNAQALRAAAELRGKRGQMLALLAAIPQLDEGSRRNAAVFLDSFFADIATDEAVTRRLLRTCVR